MRSYLQIKQLVKKELSIIENKMLSAVNICEPLNSHIKSFLTAPSKRIRPVLAILYNKAQNSELTDNQLEILSAMEIVHNASLIHDDIIDESNFRRGEKSINAKFGNKLSVIAGDYLLSLALEKIAKSGKTEIFAKTLKQMCIGEINQNSNLYKIGTIEDYIEKSKNKTGYLFECAIPFQNISVACPRTANKSLIGPHKKHPFAEAISPFSDSKFNGETFGMNFGIAFQIRDDLINILKSDNSKPAADIENGIYTAPVIFAGSVENYEQGIEKTRVLLDNYIENSKELIRDFEDNIYTNALRDLLESLKNE